MTSHFALRAGIVGGLPLATLLLVGLAGCNGAPEDPADGVGPVQEDFRFPHWCGGFHDMKCHGQDVCLPFVARGCPGPRRIGLWGPPRPPPPPPPPPPSRPCSETFSFPARVRRLPRHEVPRPGRLSAVRRAG